MNEIIDFLTEFNAVTVVIRVVLAALAGLWWVWSVSSTAVPRVCVPT